MHLLITSRKMVFLLCSSIVSDLLAFVSDKIARACNSSAAIAAVVLNVSKAFHRAWHAGLFHKRKSGAFSAHLILSLLSNRKLLLVLYRKLSRRSLVNSVVPQRSICGPTRFLVLNDDLTDIIWNIAMYADNTVPWLCSFYIRSLKPTFYPPRWEQ